MGSRKGADGQYHQVKAEKVTRMMLVRHIVNDILNGATRSVILSKVKEDAYGIGRVYSENRCDEFIRQARDIIPQATLEMIPTNREDMINRLLDVYTDARERGDSSGALRALDQISKVTGLYEQKLRVEGNMTNEIIIDFGFDLEDADSQNQGD